MRHRLEFGDALLIFYIAAFVRQWFWGIESNIAAWTLTAFVSALVWLAHLAAKPEVVGKTPRAFWLAVGLPLLLVYTIRAPFPDTSYDVLNHRLIQGERALRGVQLLPGDFFPTTFPFNPSSDMLTGVFRYMLGYRLGTIISYLALVWAGTILEKLLRPFIEKSSWRFAAVLLVLFTEHVLFEINNYMVDLLALPLLLEATRLALHYNESEHKSRDLLFSSLLLGTSVALKLTNAPMVAPVIFLFVLRGLASRQRAQTFRLMAFSAVLFLLPMLAHAIYIYRETSSPFFPLYNTTFGSPLWPLANVYDGRWGPHGWGETLMWPFIVITEPQRLSELNVYSGRITLGVVAAALCLLVPRPAPRTRLLALLLLVGTLAWSTTSGYIRYGLFLEVISGVLLLYLARYAFERLTKLPRRARVGVAAVPLCLLIAHCALAARYVAQTEWSLRPTLFDDAGAFSRELRWVLRDRDLLKFQPAEARELFGRVDAWVVSDVLTNGIEVLLRPEVPMLAVKNDQNFVRRRSRERFERTLERFRGKRIYTLSMTENLDESLAVLERRGLVVGEVRALVVPFYSAGTQFHMTLIEVGLPARR